MPSPKKKQALGRGLNALMGEAQTCGLCTAAYEYSLACLFHVKHNEL